MMGCRDRMCGALDCDTCYPGNPYGSPCAKCLEDYDECECDEFEPSDDSDDDYDPREDDDRFEGEYEDYWGD